MYKIYCDSYLLYSDTITNLQVVDASLTLEVNKSGSFDFTLYPDHPYFDMVQKMKSIITVWQDGFLLFRGRVLNVTTGFHKQKSFSCEGELAFLLDSVVRPYEFSGSITEFLQMLIENHNDQADEEHQFALGNVTVTDANGYITRSNSGYTQTWKEVEDKLIKSLGGYISTRHVDDVTYVDYLADFTLQATQAVTFGKNLIDLKNVQKGENIATALIPLGAKLQIEEGTESEERLTITDVNGGLDYIVDDDAAELYGLIFTTQTWDDVTLPENLLRKGQEYLQTINHIPTTLEIKAADLAPLDKTVTSFHLGTYVQVTTKPHSIDHSFLVTKLSINILNPASNSLTLGATLKSFTEQSADATRAQNDLVVRTEQIAANTGQAITQLEQNLQASINSSAESLMATVSEQYYLKDETDRLISEQSTQVELLKNEFNIQFTEYSQDLEAVQAGTDAEFEEIRKYIRFVGGKILLGAVGNELELKISNDRISFLQNNVEVAYFTNRKLYVTDGEYTNSLQLGKFAFIPRSNGNLSFKKIN